MLRTLATVLAMAAALSVWGGPALAEPLKIVSQAPPMLPGVSSFLLHSDRIGHDFQITVHPPSATPFLPGQKFPVVYALDGGQGVAGAIGSLLGGTGAIAPAYEVEIGYLPGQADFRNTDLAHVVAKPQFGGPAFGGGGAAFTEAAVPAVGRMAAHGSGTGCRGDGGSHGPFPELQHREGAGGAGL